MHIDTLFPTTIYTKDCRNLISEDHKTTAKAICFENGDYEFQSKCISTVRSNLNVLEHPRFDKIKNQINSSIKDFAAYLKLDTSKSYEVEESWLNYYQPGMYQEEHIHHGSLISGVIYIIGSGTADFYVKSPLSDMQSILPVFEHNSEFENYNYDTIDGRILLFLSSTKHATRPTDKEKISLSFNIR